LGFVAALHVTNALLGGGAYRHVAIVCSEAGLGAANWKEAESACLMGDGAAAVVLRRAEPRPTDWYRHETFAPDLGGCEGRGGASRLPPSKYCAENETEYLFHMDGPGAYRIALKHLPPLVDRLVRESGLARGDLHVVPHQASPRAVEGMRRALGFERERF